MGRTVAYPKTDSSQHMLNIEQAARYLGTSPRHVQNLYNARNLPFFKVGHYVRFRRADLDKWLEAQRVPSRDEVARQRREERQRRTLNSPR